MTSTIIQHGTLNVLLHDFIYTGKIYSTDMMTLDMMTLHYMSDFLKKKQACKDAYLKFKIASINLDKAYYNYNHPYKSCLETHINLDPTKICLDYTDDSWCHHHLQFHCHYCITTKSTLVSCISAIIKQNVSDIE